MTALGLVLACGLTTADIESGPKAGAKVPALKAYGVVGPVEMKDADFAAERKDAPTIYLFVQADESGLPVGKRPVAAFMRALDAELGKLDGAAAVAVWLGDKTFDKNKEYLPRFQTSMGLERTQLAAFDGERSGPDGWGVNPDAPLTAVVAVKGKVVKSFAYTTVNATDVRPVMVELRNAIKG